MRRLLGTGVIVAAIDEVRRDRNGRAGDGARDSLASEGPRHAEQHPCATGKNQELGDVHAARDWSVSPGPCGWPPAPTANTAPTSRAVISNSRRRAAGALRRIGSRGRSVHGVPMVAPAHRRRSTISKGGGSSENENELS